MPCTIWNITRTRDGYRSENSDVCVSRINLIDNQEQTVLLRISSGNGKRIAGHAFRSHVASAFSAIAQACGITVRWCFNDIISALAAAENDPIDAPKFRINTLTIERKRGESDIANHAVLAELNASEGQLRELTNQCGQRLLHELQRVEGDWQVEVSEGQEVPREYEELFQRLRRKAQHAVPAGRILPDARPVAIQPRLNDVESALRLRRNLILEGVPGTGKSHAILELSRNAYRGRLTTVVMHPAIGYEDLVEGVRPTSGGRSLDRNLRQVENARFFHECYGPNGGAQVNEANGVFGIRGGHFLLACAEACRRPNETFLLVLDEINRCNVPRAFGELLLLLESSKRWSWNGREWEGKHSAVLPYSGLDFFMPDNLHVLGTMNTTDRSVAPLDQALRRRFAFYRLNPMTGEELKAAIGPTAAVPIVTEAIETWHALNEVLESSLGPDMKLGHSYFFDVKDAIERAIPASKAVLDMWRLAVLPQLIDIVHASNHFEPATNAGLVRHLKKQGLALVDKGVGLHRMILIERVEPTADP